MSRWFGFALTLVLLSCLAGLSIPAQAGYDFWFGPISIQVRTSDGQAVENAVFDAKISQPERPAPLLKESAKTDQWGMAILADGHYESGVPNEPEPVAMVNLVGISIPGCDGLFGRTSFVPPVADAAECYATARGEWEIAHLSREMRCRISWTLEELEAKIAEIKHRRGCR